MKKWTNEIVNVCWEDGEMVAIMHQNGEIKMFTLKPVTKQDTQDLLEIETVK